MLMVTSHLLAAAPAWSALRRGILPAPAIAAAISFIFYYDFGLAAELLGFDYEVPYFRSILDARRDTQWFVISMLIVSPWILRAGAKLAGPANRPDSAAEGRFSDATKRPWLGERRRLSFYVIACITTAMPAWYGLTHLIDGGEIWQIRTQVGANLGPLIILLSLPMYILAFYAATEDARTPKGRMFILYLAFAAICASIICSQRTLVLFPIILAALSFFRRISFWKAFTIATGAIVFAAVILPIFRASYTGQTFRDDNLLVEIIHNDFSRAAVIATVTEVSPPVGTDVLPRTLSGYLYSALYFVPRQLAPFKGRSTAMHFTGFIVNQPPEWLNWGFGVGMLEELILNVGTRYCLLGVCAYGLVIGWLSRIEVAYPTVSMPLRIGPVFLCGYHLPSLLSNFALMWIVCIYFSWLFIELPTEANDEVTSHSDTCFAGSI